MTLITMRKNSCKKKDDTQVAVEQTINEESATELNNDEIQTNEENFNKHDKPRKQATETLSDKSNKLIEEEDENSSESDLNKEMKTSDNRGIDNDKKLLVEKHKATEHKSPKVESDAEKINDNKPKSPKSTKIDDSRAQLELRSLSRMSAGHSSDERKLETKKLFKKKAARKWSAITPKVPIGEEMRYCLENVKKAEAQLRKCKETCWEPPPKKRPYFPYIYNGLDPYFNTDVLDCMVKQCTRGRTHSIREIRPIVENLVTPAEDFNMEKKVKPLPPVKELLRDKHGNAYPADRQESMRMSQEKLSYIHPSVPEKYKEHRFETKNLSFSSSQAKASISKKHIGPDYSQQATASYKDIEKVRQWAKRERKLWCELKEASEYERTMNDFYHFELYKLDEMRPKTRQNMRLCYEAYLSNTDGSRRALKESLAEVDKKFAEVEEAKKAREERRLKMTHVLSEQSLLNVPSKAIAVTKLQESTITFASGSPNSRPATSSSHRDMTSATPSSILKKSPSPLVEQNSSRKISPVVLAYQEVQQSSQHNSTVSFKKEHDTLPPTKRQIPLFVPSCPTQPTSTKTRGNIEKNRLLNKGKARPMSAN